MISVVIPVYNEEKNLSLLMDRLEKVMQSLERPYEIIFVDDGSRDRSLEILKGFMDRPGVRVVELTRNYGQHPAVFSGFSVVRGDVKAVRLVIDEGSLFDGRVSMADRSQYDKTH